MHVLSEDKMSLHGDIPACAGLTSQTSIRYGSILQEGAATASPVLPLSVIVRRMARMVSRISLGNEWQSISRQDVLCKSCQPYPWLSHARRPLSAHQSLFACTCSCSSSRSDYQHCKKLLLPPSRPLGLPLPYPFCPWRHPAAAVAAAAIADTLCRCSETASGPP